MAERNRNRGELFKQLVIDMGQQVRALGQEVPHVTSGFRRAIKLLVQPIPEHLPSRKDPLNGEKWTSLVAQKVSVRRRIVVVDHATFQGADFSPMILASDMHLKITLSRMGKEQALIFTEGFANDRPTAIVVHEVGTEPARMLVKGATEGWRVVDPLKDKEGFDPRELYSYMKGTFVSGEPVNQRALVDNIEGVRLALGSQPVR